jgi:hypothetical protein
MSLKQGRYVFVFILGMLTFAVGNFIVTAYILVERPTPDGIVEDWGRICFWLEEGVMYTAVSPKGCYSTTCTAPKLQAGTAVLDLQNNTIHLETRFVLAKTPRFPLPCAENCGGGGAVQFKLGQLIPNEYGVWFRDQRVGNLQVFSGRPTPRQCFDNESE